MARAFKRSQWREYENEEEFWEMIARYETCEWCLEVSWHNEQCPVPRTDPVPIGLVKYE